MPLRMLSGRPRPVQVLILSLLVLATGVASGLSRAHQPVTFQAAAVTADEFYDVPTTATSPRAVDPPATPPQAPVAAPPATPPVPDRAAESSPAVATPAPPPAPAPTPVAPKAEAPAAPAVRAPLIPVGKGMWLYQLSMAAGGSATAVVKQAKAVGLTHLYLRVGSSKGGFYNQDELNRLLPVAHAAGLKVIGWDFVYLNDPVADALRAKSEIDYVTPDGHRMDAFSADIETASEGVNLTPEGAAAYGAKLRKLVGPGYPLIATVPRPSAKRPFPFAEATRSFDAIAPMVYWMNRDPATDVAGALAALAPLGKPVLPVGQAYDGGPEGGPKGDPPKEALVAFMNTALAKGAVGVSFWVWNHATPDQWSAIDGATQWELPATGLPKGGAAVYLQRVLAVLGQPVAQDGVIGPSTRAAITAVQHGLGLPGTGKLDAATVRSITGPRR